MAHGLAHDGSTPRRFRGRGWPWTALAVGLALGLGLVGDAAAQMSSFRVTQARVKGKALELEIAWQHEGRSTPVEFYAHAALPPHEAMSVIRGGLELKKFEMPPGAGTNVLSIPLKKLDRKLSLAPGSEVFVAAVWPDLGMQGFGHRWGTSARRGGTSIAIPSDVESWHAQPNSALRRAAAGRLLPLLPRGRLATGLRGAAGLRVQPPFTRAPLWPRR